MSTARKRGFPPATIDLQCIVDNVYQFGEYHSLSLVAKAVDLAFSIRSQMILHFLPDSFSLTMTPSLLRSGVLPRSWVATSIES